MKQNITIRKRKSVKHGTTFEYRFETASRGGQRKWISKGGFLDEKTARIEGVKALNEYNTCGQVIQPTVLMEKGAPLKYIRQRLGHKKIDVTLNVYQHLTDDLRRVGTNVLNNMFDRE